MLDEILAKKILEDFDDLCRTLDIRYCLIGGTCLGLYRDGRFIPWDDDMDVWVDLDLADKKFHLMLRCLRALGFVFLSDNHRFCRDNTWLDIFVGNDPVGILPFVRSFDTVVYNNRIYNLPHPVEEWMEIEQKTYGGWRIPTRL